eukprot:TRINITY_DN28263_c0_g1_i2.p1 TRINITY_DN28263_c0_g1~~TRINITY_DN28263_c0_g1_i2.p1  ORF type:complete len:1010 (-),score=176.79 TRINITY_DN28263_c0_g1_i2:13-2919(-)
MPGPERHPRESADVGTSNLTECESITVQLRHVCLEYPYKQLEAATNGFHESCRLGSGSAGSVYRVELPDGSYAAVKSIDLSALGDNAIVAGFEDEIMILSKFRHPNLVVLMGWAKEGTRRFLLYEFLSGGDLTGRLQKSKANRLPFMWHERLAVLRDAATGLAHLHNATPRAFHRDIKSSNILLGPSGAKMADFGLSCEAKSRTSSAVDCEHPSGTPGYACPIYMQTGKVTEGSEVYSFGMVALEALLNLLPAGMIGEEIKFPIQEVLQPQNPGVVERAVANADPTAGWPLPVAAEVATLALTCINGDEAARPCFNDICKRLRALQEQFPPSCVVAMQAPQMPQPPPPMPGMPGMSVPYMAHGQATGLLPHPAPGASTGWPGMPGARSPQVPQFWPPQQVVPSGAGWPPGTGIVPPHGQPMAPQFSGFQHPMHMAPVFAPRGPMPPPAGVPMPGGMSVPHPHPSAASNMPPPQALAEVALEITHVRLAQLSCMKPEFRMLPLQPSINGEGRRMARFGRAHQPHWFEAVLVDAMDLNCISREACELSWGGPIAEEATLKMLVLGSGIVLVDEKVVPQGHVAHLRPGTRIALVKQVPQGLEPIIALAVHCAAMPVVPEGPSQSQLPTQEASAHVPAGPGPPRPVPLEFDSVPEEREPPPNAIPEATALKADTWRLECVFAAGFAPEAFAVLPLCARSVTFQLAPGSAPQVMGREPQQELFQALLYHEPSLLNRVSRSHFKLEPPEREGGGVKVTNLSLNVAVVAQRPLHQGQSAVVLDGDTLSFAQSVPVEVAVGEASPADAEAASTVPFLTFRLIGPPPPAPPTPFAMLSLPSLNGINVSAHPPVHDDAVPDVKAVQPIEEEPEAEQLARRKSSTADSEDGRWKCEDMLEAPVAPVPLTSTPSLAMHKRIALDKAKAMTAPVLPRAGRLQTAKEPPVPVLKGQARPQRQDSKKTTRTASSCDSSVDVVG